MNLIFQLPVAITDGIVDGTIILVDELIKALLGWLDRIKDFFNNFGEYFSNIFTREGRREKTVKEFFDLRAVVDSFHNKMEFHSPADRMVWRCFTVVNISFQSQTEEAKRLIVLCKA